MAWRKNDSSQMKELLDQNTSNQNPDSRRQHGGEHSGCQGGSSSSFSSCPSSLDRTSDETKKDLENQDKKTQHSRRLDCPETSSSSASSSSFKRQENLRVTTQDDSGGGSSQASSSSSLHPSSPTKSAKAAWEGERMSTTEQGSGGGFHRSDHWLFPSSSSSGSTSTEQGKHGEKGPDSQEMKTRHGSGGSGGFGYATSSNLMSPPPTQSVWGPSDDQAGKGPGNQTKTRDGSGGGGGLGHASSSSPPSSSSSQSFRHQSEGQGGKGPGNQMKTRHGSGGASGQTESYSTPPSSPSDPSLRSERSAEEFKFQVVENHFAEVKASSCCSSTELKRIEDCRDVLGILKPSKKHTVLIDCDTFNNNSRIVPFSGEHKWKPNFVKLPCSQIQSQGMFSQDSRWKQIKKQLGNLASKPTASVRDVAEAILSFNPKYNGQWTFGSLDNFVRCLPRTENYVDRLFPKIAKLALKLPDEVKTAIPLLRSGHVAAITLSQTQIACLLANAFFCTFPHRNTTRPNAEYHNYPSINFSSLFGNRLERKIEKLRAIMHYFNTVTDSKTDLSGLVTFERRLLRKDDEPQWKSCTEKINRLYVTSEGHIEKEGRGLLQVDFANCLVGGGVLGSGLVQEEILFIINPELIVSRLFTERLQDGECLIVTGSQQFSSYSGYSDSFEWLGPHEEHLHRDEWRRLQRQIVAIDAVHYRNPRDQYSMGKITRELNKAYCGFKGRLHHDNPDIATGKWGCGAFNGDPQLKAVIQLMAAAKAGRGLAFFTFQDKLLERQLQGMHHLLVTSGITVGKLYGLLQDYCARLHGGAHLDLFSFLQRALKSDWSHL